MMAAVRSYGSDDAYPPLKRLCNIRTRGLRNWHIFRLKFKMRNFLAWWCECACEDEAHFHEQGVAVMAPTQAPTQAHMASSVISVGHAADTSMHAGEETAVPENNWWGSHSPALYLLQLDLVDFFGELDTRRSTDEATEVVRAFGGQIPTRLQRCLALVTDNEAVIYAFLDDHIKRRLVDIDLWERLADPKGLHRTFCFEVVPKIESFKYNMVWDAYKNIRSYLERGEARLIQEKVLKARF
jgi:hypothetical protein